MVAGVSARAGVTVSYNGWAFDVTLEPPRITLTPRYSRDGRTVSHVVHRIELVAIVTASDTATDMASLREYLTQPAGYLRIEGTGYGDLTVNDPGGGGVRDVMWGPKPTVLSTEQIGDNRAWRIRWTCETALPEQCPDASSRQDRLLEWSWSPSYTVGADGLTTRRVSGYVAIPQTRQNVDSRLVTRTIDEWKDTVMSQALIPGFRRTPGDWTVSADKCSAEFSFTDTQLEGYFAPPPGVIEVRADHEMRTVKDMGWFQYLHSLTATYKTAKGFPKAAAFNWFMGLWIERTNLTRRSGGQVIPLSISIRDSIYSMETTLAMRWTTSMPGKPTDRGQNEKTNYIQRTVRDSGLWGQPPHSTWHEWAQSLEPNAWSPRGVAQIKLQAQDYIVDICDSRQNILAADQNVPEEFLKAREIVPNNGVPPPGESWLTFRTWLNVDELPDTANLKLLPENEVTYDPSVEATIRIDSEDGGYQPSYARPQNSSEVIQQRAMPSYDVVFEGKAVRAGYPIPAPRLREVGGEKAYLVRDPYSYFIQDVNNNLIVPIATAIWRQRYRLANVPKRAILPPFNPLHGGVGRATERTLDGFLGQ